MRVYFIWACVGFIDVVYVGGLRASVYYFVES